MTMGILLLMIQQRQKMKLGLVEYLLRKLEKEQEDQSEFDGGVPI